jgi:hypothetical protein
MPTNGAFRATDLPDQVSLVHDANVRAIGRWRASYHERERADNRQASRSAPTSPAVERPRSAMMLGLIDVNLDGNAGTPEQGVDQTTTVHRLASIVNWRPTGARARHDGVLTRSADDRARRSRRMASTASS